MTCHPWCRDIQRDEAVRAAEDNRSGPLPTLTEGIAAMFPKSVSGSSPLSAETKGSDIAVCTVNFRDWMFGTGEFSEENLAKSRQRIGEKLARMYHEKLELELWKAFGLATPKKGSDPGG